MKKYLFISHVLDNSGSPRALLELLKHKPQTSNYKIYLVGMRWNHLENEFRKYVNHIKVITKNPPQNLLLKSFERLKSIYPLYLYIRKLNPDLVFINSSANTRAIFLSKLMGYKTYVFVHEFEESYRKLGKIRKNFIKLADKVFVTNQIQKEWIRHNIGYKKDIVIIPNGIDIKIVEKKSTNKVPYKFLKFKNKFKYIISTIGYISYVKGWDIFLEIAKKLNNEDIGFVIVGDFIESKEKNKFFKLAKKYNLMDKIYITGIVNNVFPYIKHSDIICITSRTETFSLVALESMAMGKPIVTFDIGAIKTVLPDGYPFLIEPFKIEEYSSSIRYILNNYQKLTHIFNKLKKRSESFDINKIARKFFEEIGIS